MVDVWRSRSSVIAEIIRPLVIVADDLLSIDKSATFTFSHGGNDFAQLSRTDLAAIIVAYNQLDPLSSEKVSFVPRRIAAPARKLTWSERWAGGRWGWTFYYALGFLGGFAAARGFL